MGRAFSDGPLAPAGVPKDVVALSCEEVEHVFKARRTINKALAGVSFTVGAGEVMGLLGPNGAGKTTLLELVSGLRSLQRGSITLFSENVPAGDPRARHRLGFLPQRSVLYEDVSIDDNLQFAAAIHRCPTKRVDEVLELIGLAGRRRWLVGALSAGMRRRVAIARALIHEPELLVLDEPTLGVDSDNRHRIWQHIRTVRRSGVAVLLSSNYLDEVEALCDRVVVLDSGHVSAVAPPGDLFRRAGWWLEAEPVEHGFGQLVLLCREQRALEVVSEEPTVRMRFADEATARLSMSQLAGSPIVSGIRARRPDLVEMFAAIRA